MQLSCALAMLICTLLSGCGASGLSGLASDYGGVAYPEKNSINGLGIFLKLCQQAGSRCFVASRLSARLDKADAIILVGNTFHPPAKEARDWLEEWLGKKSGRSVVYFGRDFDADIYYREQTLEAVDPDQQHRAAIDLADRQAGLDAMRVRELSNDVFCRWFNLKMHDPRAAVGDWTGPWAESLHATAARWPVRARLEPPRASQSRNKPKWHTSPFSRPKIGPSQPNRRSEKSSQPEHKFYQSVWSTADINDDETWAAEWDKLSDSRVLLAGQDGTPLVTELTSPRYPGSQILTIVNGAPLLNGSIVQAHFRAVAHHIIGDLQPAKRIALLPFDAQGIVISNVQEEEEIAGISVLTTWPMNMIVAHLAFLGVLICLALFPILGRPQGAPRPSLSDFGQHAEAVGRMLQRTGDAQYALRIVNDYFRIVRGEVPPSWLKSAIEPPSETDTPVVTSSANSDSSP